MLGTLACLLACVYLLSNAFALKPTDPDWKTAVLTFDDAKAAADLGDAYAQAVVSIYSFVGWQTENNPTTSWEYAQKSADQKNPLGLYMLGASYRAGPGPPARGCSPAAGAAPFAHQNTRSTA